MKIVGIMAAHQRPEITTETLKLLKTRQTLPFHEIVVMGGPEEEKCAMKAGCTFLQVPNEPLGRKYQCGLFWSRTYDPDAVVILGSDTWLSAGWLDVVAGFVEDGADCCGVMDWHTCRVASGQPLEILHVGYDPALRNEPVGGGRTYSRRLLEMLDWDLFPIGAGSNLDYLTLQNVTAAGGSCMVMDGDETVMGVKGPWPTLNQFDRLKKSRALKHFLDVTNPKKFLERQFPGGAEALGRVVADIRWEENG